jgi:hypothetical protein
MAGSESLMTIMRGAWVVVALILGSVPRVAHAQEGQTGAYALPDSLPQMYDPMTFDTAESGPSFLMGPVELSTSSAKFAKLRGTMRLMFETTTPADTPGEDLASTRLYRIVNADEYFALNKGKPGFCYEPPRWMALRAIDRSIIRLTFFDIRDWRKYRDNKLGECSSSFYSLRDDPSR